MNQETMKSGLRCSTAKVPLLCAFVFFLGIASALAQNKPPAGFRALFNGRDLAGWHGVNFDPRELWAMDTEARAKKRAEDMKSVREHWSVEDGEIVNDGHGVFLTTDEVFGDMEFLVDYKTVAKADSGIYLRANPQVQIWDYTKAGGKWSRGADKGSGGLWNNSVGAPGKDPLVLADRPFGEWNRLRILQVGARTTVHLNEKLVVDHAVMENVWDRDLPLWRQGPIQLQTHGGEIRWRNVFVREIAPAEAHRLLARDDDKFEAIFNGQDFTGWQGKIESYEVKDGAIQCKAGAGGNIYTVEEYADFIVRLEFKLPPGGNNGLAIRYPGIENLGKANARQPDTAYEGMCELQVLDNTAPEYSDIDPRQYHGSAYGMVAAHSMFEYGGLQRPVGEWNYQQVTVRGSTIRVELNGTTILDADLKDVTEFMGGTAHPGKDRRSGYFGFAGHDSPVAFRNIRIRRLP